MNILSTLKNTTRPVKKVQRVGRGMGSNRGKTCGRGTKGDKARSGYKRRYGHEGGQLPLYRKLPCRGFTNGRFRTKSFAINLGRLNDLYRDGDVVSSATLQEKGIPARKLAGGLRILSGGDLKKKVSIEAHHFSQEAKDKLDKLSVTYTQLS